MSNSLVLICFVVFLCTKFAICLVCKEYINCSTSAVSLTTESNRFTSPLPTWLESCSCDQNCYSFGDCCLDAPAVYANPLNGWSTLNIKVSPKFTYSVLMKTKCPNDWTNIRVRQMCQNIGHNESEDFFLSDLSHLISTSRDEFLLWPVSSKSTLITYRNIYCALCNNDTQLESWSQRLRCLKTENGTQIRCSSVSYPSAPNFLVQEKIRRKPHQLLVTTKCNIGWYKTNLKINAQNTIDIVKNCTLFFAPVVVQDNALQKFTAFKNEFCAKCNGFEPNVMICPSESQIFYEHQIPKHFDRETTFDTDFIKGGKFANLNDSCIPGYVFNPFDSHCRQIMISEENDEEMVNDNEEETEEPEEEEDKRDSNSISTSSTTTVPKIADSAKHPTPQLNKSLAKSLKCQQIIIFLLFSMNLISNVFVL